MTLRITAQSGESFDILKVSGEIDYSNCELFSERAEEILAMGRGVIADLRDVAYLDSHTVGRLLHIRETAVKNEEPFVIVPGPLVEEILEMAGLIHLFTIHGSIEEAVGRMEP